MRNLVLGCLLIITIASCSKKDDATPQVSSTTLGTKSTVTTSSSASKDSTFKIGFELPSQIVTTKVSASTLTMIYTERVNLLVDPTEYDSSWALHLTESFTNTFLSAYDYTTVTKEGNVTTNWVDDNLNDVILQGKVDTTINGVKKVKVKVQRNFTFVKQFSDAATAATTNAALLNRKSDVINFTSFYYSTNSSIHPATAKATIAYVAAP